MLAVDRVDLALGRRDREERREEELREAVLTDEIGTPDPNKSPR